VSLEWDLLQWFRAMLSLASFLVSVVLAIQTFRVFRDLSSGQKLLLLGLIFVLIYVADACRAAVAVNLDFTWRVVPLTLGLICLLAYIIEPDRKRRKRIGRRMLDTDN
jgi:hypothetical protein